MSLNFEKQEEQGKAYSYTATCSEETYSFQLIGKGATATEAEDDLLKQIAELKKRLDEVSQFSKVSA